MPREYMYSAVVTYEKNFKTKVECRDIYDVKWYKQAGNSVVLVINRIAENIMKALK